jgi:hypothetical protein
MKKTALFRANVYALFVAIACGAKLTAFAYAADQAAETEAGGWKTIAGGPGTGCATDATPYEFYIHEGDPHRIAIHKTSVRIRR